MTAECLNRLEFLLECIPGLLGQLTEEGFTHRISPEKWSKKEILGHLIDSAANNHQRFVRAQFEESPFIRYDQHAWNKHGFYSKRKTADLIRFWTEYNRFLLELLRHMPQNAINKQCRTGETEIHRLEFLIDDYVKHMENHLRQLITY